MAVSAPDRLRYGFGWCDGHRLSSWRDNIHCSNELSYLISAIDCYTNNFFQITNQKGPPGATALVPLNYVMPLVELLDEASLLGDAGDSDDPTLASHAIDALADVSSREKMGRI